MKILFLTNRIPFPVKDGGSTAMRNMMLGLKNAGAEISLFSINTKKHHNTLEGLSQEFKSLFNYLCAVDLNTDINIKDAFLNLFNKKSYNIDRFDSQHVRNELRKFVKNFDFDIVQVEGVYMSMYHDVIREELPNAKLLLRCHNVEYEIWSRLAINAKFLKKKYLTLLTERLKEYEISIYSKFDLLIAISERDRVQISSTTNVPCQVCLVGVEKPLRNSKKPYKDNLFFIGSLDWRPNREGLNWFLKQIWPKIHLKYPHLTFSIAGRNTPKSIRKWNGKRNILVHGEVADSKDFIQENGIMVVPILSGSGTRVKIIEAMMLGKCVFSTSIGAEGLGLVDKNNFLLTDTLDDFIQKIAYALSDPKNIKHIQGNAVEYANENFELENVSNKLISSYKEIL